MHVIFFAKNDLVFCHFKMKSYCRCNALPIQAWDCSGIFLGISHWIRKAEDDNVVVSTKNPWYVIWAFEGCAAVSHPCHSWTLKGHLYSPNATKSLWKRWFTFAFYESEVRFFDLVFLHGAGYPGNPCYGGQARLGNQHHAEKLSPRIALHFRKVQK